MFSLGLFIPHHWWKSLLDILPNAFWVVRFSVLADGSRYCPWPQDMSSDVYVHLYSAEYSYGTLASLHVLPLSPLWRGCCREQSWSLLFGTSYRDYLSGISVLEEPNGDGKEAPTETLKHPWGGGSRFCPWTHRHSTLLLLHSYEHWNTHTYRWATARLPPSTCGLAFGDLEWEKSLRAWWQIKSHFPCHAPGMRHCHNPIK